MDRLNNILIKNLGNLFLFVPVIFSLGILLYFNLDFEPVIKYSKCFLLLNIIILIFLYFKKTSIKFVYFTLISAILLFSFGFLYSYSYTHTIPRTGLNFKQKDTTIIATVQGYDYSADKTKLILYDAKILNKPNIKPLKIKISGDFQNLPKINDIIKLNVSIFPPASPDSPYSFDFSRWAFFNNLNGNGFATSDFTIIGHKNSKSINPFIQNIRHYIHNQSYSVSENSGKLVDALVLGYSKSIDKNVSDNYKSAGISHVLSISGFHMALLGGWFFCLFLLFVKCFPGIIKRIPASKIAIWPSILFLFAYLLISGAHVSSLRAFTITLIGYLALFFNKTVFSLRNCMIVFWILLFINPHYILEAGFQLSFSAVVALIYFYSNHKINGVSKDSKFISKIFQYIWIFIKTTILTSFIAGLATMPFIAYHFHSITIYGVIGNLLCLPFFVILILPLSFLGTLSVCLFNWKFPLLFMDNISNIVNQICFWISSLPLSNIQMPVISGISIVLFFIGVVCYMFFKTKIKLVGIFFIILAIFYTLILPKPILYSSPLSEVIAVQTDSHLLRFNKTSSMDNRFVFQSWAMLNSQEEPTREMKGSFRKGFYGKEFSMICKNKVCIYKTPKLKIAMAIKFIDVYKNINYLCSRHDIDYIISAFGIKYNHCKPKLITPYQIGNNAFVIYPDGKIKSVNSNRYWSPKYHFQN